MKPCACSLQHTIATSVYRAAGQLHRAFKCHLCSKVWVLSYPDVYAPTAVDEVSNGQEADF